jgi:hypothetical protein
MHITILSGGQTGVDRAALDVALERGLPCGGWCPAGRWAEDGPVPARYPLRETLSADPAERTEWNVRDADATLVVAGEDGSAGTALTGEVARRLGRPVWRVAEGAVPDPAAFRGWLDRHRVRVLNVAGPRESESPGVGERTRVLLRALLPPGGAP